MKTVFILSVICLSLFAQAQHRYSIASNNHGEEYAHYHRDEFGRSDPNDQFGRNRPSVPPQPAGEQVSIARVLDVNKEIAKDPKFLALQEAARRLTEKADGSTAVRARTEATAAWDKVQAYLTAEKIRKTGLPIETIRAVESMSESRKATARAMGAVAGLKSVAVIGTGLTALGMATHARSATSHYSGSKPHDDTAAKPQPVSNVGQTAADFSDGSK
jgi:hypothetical protein